MQPQTEFLPNKLLSVHHPAVYAGTVVLLIAGIMIWVWSPILDVFFYADDFLYLLGAQTPGVLRSFFMPGGTDLVWVYRPLASFGYYWIIRSLFGLNPNAFHLTTLAVHLLNATLVAWLMSRLGCSRLTSLFISLIYAAHISHWHGLVTTTFQEVLAAFLFFSALAAFLRTQSSLGGENSMPTLALACFGAALLSKETAFSLPLLLTWLEIVHPSPSPPTSPLWVRFRWILPFYLVAGVYSMILYLTGSFPHGENYALGLDLSVFQRLKQYFWYALEPPVWGLSYESNLAILLFAGLVIILWRHWQVRFGLGWFLISLLPVLFMPKRTDPQYVMIGLLGLCLAVGVGVDRALAIISKGLPRMAPYIGVIVLGCILFIDGSKARSHFLYEIQAGWTGRTQRFARCVASHVLRRYPAGLPAKTVIFRGFDGHEKWTIWGGAILNVLYHEPGIRSLFVPDPALGPSHPLFSWKGEAPEADRVVTIDRRDIIEPCEIHSSLP